MPRFLRRWFRIDWTGALTDDRRALAEIELRDSLRFCFKTRWICGLDNDQAADLAARTNPSSRSPSGWPVPSGDGVTTVFHFPLR